jgi:hypothetical protein
VSNIISFEDYAFVSAGVADGLELAVLLRHLEVDPEVWRLGEQIWRERLRQDDSIEGGLHERLANEQEHARELWSRPIPPLDDDLDAWIDFQRHLLEQPNPLAHLEQLGITFGDLARLATLWQGRIHQDRTLLERMAKRLTEPPADVRIAPLPPPRLPGSDPAQTLKLRALADQAGADSSAVTLDDEDATATLLPPLSMDLPKVEDLDALMKTHSIDNLQAFHTPSLPFQRASHGTREKAHPPAGPSGDRAAPRPPEVPGSVLPFRATPPTKGSS